MSLHIPADGLLGTHVTWQEVEEQMQKALDTTARFGDDKTVTNISDMKGFMSRIALVEPHWVGATETEDLPAKFVVKISSQLPFIEMMTMMEFAEKDYWNDEKTKEMEDIVKMFHNREVATYKILIRENHPNIPINKIYAMKSFDDENTVKAYIISEYCPNIQDMGMHECISVEDLLPVVRAAATLSAIGVKLTEEETKFANGMDFVDVVFKQFVDESSVLKSHNIIRQIFPDEYQEKVEQLLKIYKDYYQNQEMLPNFKNTCNFFGYKPVFTHSDLWSANFLCTKDGDRLALKAIIDFQTVSIATPAQDVGRLFVSCLSTKDRREKLDFLLEEYYNVFVSELEGMEIPYTLQQLKDSYEVFFPLMSTLIIPGIALLLKHSAASEESKEAMKAPALDKMVGLLEDSLSTHESILQKFPKYFDKI